jgi:hypothetical protein
LWVGFDGLDYLHRCKLLDVSDDALQAFFIISADDHVQTAAHDAIGTDLKPLVFLAIEQAVQENIFVLAPDENIQPMNDRGGDEIQFVVVTDFVLAAHAN